MDLNEPDKEAEAKDLFSKFKLFYDSKKEGFSVKFNKLKEGFEAFITYRRKW